MLLLDEPFGMLDSLTRFELQQVLLDLWNRTRLTALMVTHDVDEALFLSDRIVMMTNGPEAEVGEILHVPFPRPRRRQELLENPEYYQLREQLIEFLHVRAYTLKGQTPKGSASAGGHGSSPTAPALPPASPVAAGA
jgi:nitrate/nitrite transport system ATP-binding protein